MSFLFWGAIISSYLLYINTTEIIKKIHNNEPYSSEKHLGAMLFSFIILSILSISLN